MTVFKKSMMALCGFLFLDNGIHAYTWRHESVIAWAYTVLACVCFAGAYAIAVSDR